MSPFLSAFYGAPEAPACACFFGEDLGDFAGNGAGRWNFENGVFGAVIFNGCGGDVRLGYTFPDK